jgi:hypothetical protein
MSTKPLKTLSDMIGKDGIARAMDVDLSTVYLWLQRENGLPGRRPSVDNMKRLIDLGRVNGVNGITIDYLAGL